MVLVPVGSMIIANAMNACAQSIERFRAHVTAHVGQIEASVVLGADPGVAVAPYVQRAVYASLLPRLDMLKSLGLVWIPGVITRMRMTINFNYSILCFSFKGGHGTRLMVARNVQQRIPRNRSQGAGGVSAAQHERRQCSWRCSISPTIRRRDRNGN